MNPLTSILYVEDDPDIQAIGKMALESLGNFHVVTCDSGQQAVAAVIQSGDYQLILLDVMMPQMDGFSTLRAIRELPGGKHIPIIFCTAKVQKSEMESYLADGAIGVIEKPFDAMAMPQEVRTLWNAKMLQGTVPDDSY